MKPPPKPPAPPKPPKPGMPGLLGSRRPRFPRDWPGPPRGLKGSNRAPGGTAPPGKRTRPLAYADPIAEKLHTLADVPLPSSPFSLLHLCMAHTNSYCTREPTHTHQMSQALWVRAMRAALTNDVARASALIVSLSMSCLHSPLLCWLAVDGALRPSTPVLPL